MTTDQKRPSLPWSYKTRINLVMVNPLIILKAYWIAQQQPSEAGERWIHTTWNHMLSVQNPYQIVWFWCWFLMQLSIISQHDRAESLLVLSPPLKVRHSLTRIGKSLGILSATLYYYHSKDYWRKGVRGRIRPGRLLKLSSCYCLWNTVAYIQLGDTSIWK